MNVEGALRHDVESAGNGACELVRLLSGKMREVPTPKNVRSAIFHLCFTASRDEYEILSVGVPVPGNVAAGRDFSHEDGSTFRLHLVAR